MNSTRTWLFLHLLAASAVAATIPVVNFDANASPDIQFTVDPVVADHDGDGDLEGMLSTREKSGALRIKLTRRSALIEQIQTHPLLRLSVRPDGTSRTSRNVKLHVVVQSEDRFEKVEQFQLSPGTSGRMQELLIDLSKLRVGEGGPTVLERVKAFSSSSEKFLFIAIHQYDKGDPVADVLYDDISLSSTDLAPARSGPR
jgi:hypothetical protein